MKDRSSWLGGGRMNLFTYGTLTDRRALAKVTGRAHSPGVPAILYGYRRLETTLGYPIILPETGASCQGTVYFGLTYTDWEHLDRYENLGHNPPPYSRRLVQVRGSHGSISAFTYVANLNYFRARIRA